MPSFLALTVSLFVFWTFGALIVSVCCPRFFTPWPISWAVSLLSGIAMMGVLGVGLGLVTSGSPWFSRSATVELPVAVVVAILLIVRWVRDQRRAGGLPAPRLTRLSGPFVLSILSLVLFVAMVSVVWAKRPQPAGAIQLSGARQGSAAVLTVLSTYAKPVTIRLNAVWTANAGTHSRPLGPIRIGTKPVHFTIPVPYQLKVSLYRVQSGSSQGRAVQWLVLPP